MHATLILRVSTLSILATCLLLHQNRITHWLILQLPLNSQLLSVFIRLRCMDDKLSWLRGWSSVRCSPQAYILIFHEQINYARFDIHTVALFGIQVFWDMTVSLGKWFLMFQRIMVPSSGRVKSSWTAWPLQMKATWYFKHWKPNHPMTQHHIPHDLYPYQQAVCSTKHTCEQASLWCHKITFFLLRKLC